jgi:phospholipid/cholesterol/gamma-HCH transport system substrate-binding protein
MRLYATVQETRGLSAGSDVWLAGQKIGVVNKIGFRPPGTDTGQRLLLTLEILQEAKPLIRRGANVQIRPGGSLVGAPVVMIGVGSPGAAVADDGDTVRSSFSRDVDRARVDVTEASAAVPVIIANVKLLAAQLRAARGTLGAFGIDGGRNVGAVAGTLDRIMTQARAPRGTVGLAVTSKDARIRAFHVIAVSDSILALVQGDASGPSIGRFRRDSTLFGTIAAVRSDLAALATTLDAPTGTIGRLRVDSALVFELRRAQSAMAALAADVQRNPLRYITF